MDPYPNLIKLKELVSLWKALNKLYNRKCKQQKIALIVTFKSSIEILNKSVYKIRTNIKKAKVYEDAKIATKTISFHLEHISNLTSLNVISMIIVPHSASNIFWKVGKALNTLPLLESFGTCSRSKVFLLLIANKRFI